jgi:hypothetical protein
MYFLSFRLFMNKKIHIIKMILHTFNTLPNMFGITLFFLKNKKKLHS